MTLMLSYCNNKFNFEFYFQDPKKNERNTDKEYQQMYPAYNPNTNNQGYVAPVSKNLIIVTINRHF